MKVHAWRLVPEHRGDAAFTGEGTRRYGARWNSPGRPVVYLSEHRSLAALEVMVQRRSVRELAQRFLLSEATWDEDLVERLPLDALPVDWRSQPPAHATVGLGDAWLRAGRSAVLAVPSALIPEELNYLLNPVHRDFARITLAKPNPFTFDPRLLN